MESLLSIKILLDSFGVINTIKSFFKKKKRISLYVPEEVKKPIKELAKNYHDIVVIDLDNDLAQYVNRDELDRVANDGLLRIIKKRLSQYLFNYLASDVRKVIYLSRDSVLVSIMDDKKIFYYPDEVSGLSAQREKPRIKAKGKTTVNYYSNDTELLKQVNQWLK